MPDPAYVTTALAVAVAITVTLRALPFAAKRALSDSPLLANFGRWMPLGAVAILAIYCLSAIEVTNPAAAAGPLAGTAVTIALHLWRRNAVLSIVAGTTACLLVTNWV
ncbi:branched-chain amino acid transporter permease [Georgenia sp. AZ-5]|uniref:branched-chain amino acid transporter permease n=1 Tax=Georgenia sp. AZ-5 TaxID=3367526 RepID=UPI0037553964